MPNPRYISNNGEPTVELLQRLTQAKQVYFSNLSWFCEKQAFHPNELEKISEVYLIGSHAQENGWHNDTSDIDFKLINKEALPEQLHVYKREVLDPVLHIGEKKRWIDLWFAREDYQITSPRWNLTSYWDSISIEKGTS